VDVVANIHKENDHSPTLSSIEHKSIQSLHLVEQTLPDTVLLVDDIQHRLSMFWVLALALPQFHFASYLSSLESNSQACTPV